jgi:hypothetical protein
MMQAVLAEPLGGSVSKVSAVTKLVAKPGHFADLLQAAGQMVAGAKAAESPADPA